MRVFLPAAIVAGSFASAPTAQAASTTIVVTSTAPSPGGSSDCTLGEAIEAANTDTAVDACAAGTGDDVVSLPTGTYTLSAADHSTPQGGVALPEIESTLTIDGANAQDTIIQRATGDAIPAFMLFHMDVSTENQCWPTCTLTIKDVTVQKAVGIGGAVTTLSGHTVIDNVTLAGNTNGPALSTGGKLTVRNSFVTNNSSSGNGGVVNAQGNVTISNTPFSFNSGGNGGVLYFGAASAVTVTSSTFESNNATTGAALSGAGTLNVTGSTFKSNSTFGGNGGAIASSGSVGVVNSYFHENYAGSGDGGAIASGGPLDVKRTTFEGNAADGYGGGVSGRGASTSIANSTFAANIAAVDGGGLYTSGGATTLSNSTLAENFGEIGGGFAWNQNGGTFALHNSLIANNSATTSPDCGSATEIVSQGYNLVGDGTGCLLTAATGDQFGTGVAPINPLLGALDAHGGTTKTFSLLDGSPAIDTGNPATPGGGGATCEQFDQRNQARPRDGNSDGTFLCDIGAYENGVGLPLLTTEKDGTGTGLVQTASDETIVCGEDCAETFTAGTSVVLIATPTTDAEFGGWVGCDSVVGDQCTVSMTNDKTVVATFIDVQSVLSVTRTGSGQGSVSSSPAGINCGLDCSELYPYGTTITLTALPASNSNFHFWSGCDTVDGLTCTFTLDEDRSVFASFSPIMRTLSVNKPGTGLGTVTSEPVGIDCGSDCSESYQIESQITLTAVVGANSEFGGWSGCDTVVNLTCTVAVNNHQAVAATFNPIQRQLDVTKAGTAQGSITSTPAGINCPGDCTQSFDKDSEVVLTANSDENVVLTGWTGCTTSTATTCTVLMSEARSVTGTFAPAQRALTVTRTGTGSGSVSSAPAGIDCGSDCTQDYDHGTSVTLTASPAVGSEFSGWTGCDSTNTTSCTVAMNGAREVGASFTLIPRTLTVTKDGTGPGSVTSSPAGIDCGADCTQTYGHGTVVTLTADGAPNGVFAGWAGCEAPLGNVCTVTMDQAENVTATFTPAQRTLTVSPSGAGSGTVVSSPAGVDCGADCSHTADHGTTLVLTASPADGSAFDQWTGCDSVNGLECTITLDGTESVTASFTNEPRTLSVSKQGAGTGSITSSPVGIDCGDTCTAPFEIGSSVTLTATPGANSTFTGWSGCDSVVGSACTVAMNTNRSPVATFGVAQRSLTVEARRVADDSVASGSVTSNVGGLDCAVPQDCVQSFAHGAEVVLTATPAAGNEFSGWTGCDVETGTTCTMTMDAAQTVAARFHNTTMPSSSATSVPALRNSTVATFGYNADGGAAGVDLTAIELWLDGPGAGDFVKVGERSGASTSGVFDEVTLNEGDGVYVVKTRARNAAGNYEVGSGTSFTLDTVAPGSSVTASAQSNTNTFEISWSADPSAEDVTLVADGPGADGPAPSGSVSSAGEIGTFTFTATEGAGSYSFYSLATDAAGNTEVAPDTADAVVNVVLCPGLESDSRVHIVGTASKDKLVGTSAAEVICGEGGNDMIIGKGGADLMVGGDGKDTVSYSERSAKKHVTVTVNKGVNDGQKGEGDSVGGGIENVIGGAGNDIITGDGGGNILKGGLGNDTLKGAGGADKLYGDKGKDKLDGGPKKDVCKTGETLIGCEVT